MRCQRLLTLLSAVLLLLAGAGALHATARKKQTTTPVSSKSAKPLPKAPTPTPTKTPAKSPAKPSTATPSKTASKTAPRSTTAKRRMTVVRERTPSAPTPARISEIQSALADKGAYQGTPNGKWDADTVSAMERFQTDHGLTPTGKLDAPTLEKLGLGSQTSGVAAPLPLSHASTNLLLPAQSPNASTDTPAAAESQNSQP